MPPAVYPVPTTSSAVPYTVVLALRSALAVYNAILSVSTLRLCTASKTSCLKLVVVVWMMLMSAHLRPYLAITVRVHALLAIAQVLEQRDRLHVHVLIHLDHVLGAFHETDRLNQRTVEQR